MDYPIRKPWTRTELGHTIDKGHHEYKRYELFDGDLTAETPKNRPHVKYVHRVVRMLRRVFGEAFVQQEGPINLRPSGWESYNPEPDAVVLTREVESFDSLDPGPEEIRLVVEVADSSLRMDLAGKAKAYALAGIGEYWVVDIEGRRIAVHRQPEGDKYVSVESYAAGEEIAPIAKPDRRIAVAAVFD